VVVRLGRHRGDRRWGDRDRVGSEGERVRVSMEIRLVQAVICCKFRRTGRMNVRSTRD
jgi:hypothetical protein